MLNQIDLFPRTSFMIENTFSEYTDRKQKCCYENSVKIYLFKKHFQ